MQAFTPSDESLAVIAQDYHGGQGSMLYALGSTGALTPGRPGVALADLLADLIREIGHAIIDAEMNYDFERYAYDVDALTRLRAEAQAALYTL